MPHCGNLSVAYIAPLPEGAGETFLAEEKTLFNALAKRLSNIMERRITERALNRANHALRMISQLNQSLIRIHNEAQLFQEACRIIVEIGGYRMAWIGIAEHDAIKSVRPIASFGVEDDYLQRAAISWADVERGRGPTGTAIREARTVFIQHIQTNQIFSPWRESALQRGYGSCIALPLRDEDQQTFGSLNIYAYEADAFDDAEIKLLEELASDLDYGIKNLRMQQKLQDQHTFLQAIIEYAPDAIELADAQTLRFIEVNAASCQLLGYTRAERLQQTVPDIQPFMAPEILAKVTQDILETGNANFETRHLCKDSSIIDVRVSVRRLYLNNRAYFLAIWRDITAEKIVYSKLQQLSQVVEQSPNPILITNLNCQIEYVNDAMLSYVGYSREKLIGQMPNIFKSGKTPTKTYQKMWENLLNGKSWQGEFINRTGYGDEKIESATIIPLRQVDGQITQYAAIKEDITARKHQEAELHKLFMAVEQSPESIVITDLAAHIEYVNQSFVRATGYTREEALGQNPRILQSGHTLQKTYDEMWAKLSQGEPWRGELINRRKNGEEYIEFAIIAPVRQESGNVTHYLAIKEDITEKKRINDELEHYRKHLEELVEIRTSELNNAIKEQNALFEVASAGIVLLNNRIIVRCNQRLDEIFGYEYGELLGKSTRCWYITDDDFNLIGIELYQQLKLGKIDMRKMQFQRKDGTRFWCRISSRAVNPDDLNQGIVVILDDISIEQAALEELNRARALAESTAKMKSDFLANMSHEIRTPMNVIIGMSHLMFKTELAPNQQDYLKKIQSSSQHLLGIINDILDLSKIESGKMVHLILMKCCKILPD